MSSNPSPAPAGQSGDAIRPIPSNPSMVFQRKRAKALLRALKRGDDTALDRARAHHAAFRDPAPHAPTLADAQLIVAREYGFSSWPRLVQYFVPLEREYGAMTFQRHHGQRAEESVQSLIARHGRGEAPAARTLAAYVPRLYGMTTTEVLATSITLDDARAAVARECRCSNWDELMARVAAPRPGDDVDRWALARAPYTRALRAMRMHDLSTLAAILAEHPEFLRPFDYEGHETNLIAAALQHELQERTPEARAVTDWLASQGADLQSVLNRSLIGRALMLPGAGEQYLLDRGADPTWVAPNGLGALEHLIVRAWGTGDAVDAVAQRVTQRRALWVAAGIGDADAVRGYFDRGGKLIPEAYRDRVPTGLGRMRLPPVGEPTQVELLAEVALIAVLNGRGEVLRVLVDHGFPIDYMGWGDMTLLALSVGNQFVASVETLITLGADLDKRGRHPDSTPREIASEMFENWPKNPNGRRILELCGAGEPDQLVAAMQARPTPELRVVDNLQEALDLAGDDAGRRGQTEIHLDNLLVGILRAKRHPMALIYLSSANVDLVALHSMIGDRFVPPDDRITRPKLILGDDARAAVERMVASGKASKLASVTSMHLLWAMLSDPDSETSRLLESLGGDLPMLRREIARAFFILVEDPSTAGQ